MQVIPAILAKSKSEFIEKVKAVMPYVSCIQLDIMDGRFVPNKTWGTPVKIRRILEDIKFIKDFEVHLMIKQPEKMIIPWKKAGAKRIIFHFEATKNPEIIIEKIKKSGAETGIAINPETPVKNLLPLLYSVDSVLVMSVVPGFSGQEFHPEVLKKIKEIKKINPKVKVGVDGGVNLQTAKKIISAGADVLNAANAIFKSDNIEETIKKLCLT